MASKDYDETLLLYPRYLALDRLPLGLPSGVSSLGSVLGRTIHQKLLCSPMNHHSHSTHRLLCLRDSDGRQHGANRVCPPHAGLADRREISTDQRKHLEKFLPAFRFQLFGMERTANFLESWLNGTYERSKLLDVSACLSSRKWKSFKKIWCSFFHILQIIVTKLYQIIVTKIFFTFLSYWLYFSLSLCLSRSLFLSLSLSLSLFLSLCRHTLCRCMITSGPHEFRTTASAPQPDAFSIEPNIIKLL